MGREKISKVISWWVFSWGIIIVIILALVLRIVNLTKFPIFADEAIYIRWAQVMQAESTLRFLPLSDGKQPLFMWLVIFTLKIFSDPLYAGRFLSVLTGLGTLVGIIALTYYLFRSKIVSLFAALLYALSPFSVFFDRLALVDSMLTMFGIWIFFLAVLTVKTMRLDMAMLTGFTLGGSLLTKSPAIFYALLLPFFSFLIPKQKSRKETIISVIKYFFLLSVIYLIGYGMYNILRLGPNFHLLGSRNMDYVFPLNHILQNPFDPLISHIKDISGWFSLLGPSIITLPALFGLIVGMKKKFKVTLLLFAWFFIPVLIQAEFAKVFTARYILFTLPYLFIISSLVLLDNRKIVKMVSGIILVFFILLSIKQNYYLLTNPEKMSLPRSERSGYLEEWTSGYGIKEVSDYIRKRLSDLPENKQVIVGTDGFFGTMPDGIQIFLNDTRAVVIGVDVWFFEVPKPLLESVAAGNETYLVVNSERFYISDLEKHNLILINRFPKAIKPDGTRNSLLFLQVLPSGI